jgi:predicted transcriptional regulator
MSGEIPPLHLRQLKADMVLKHLSMGDVSRKTRIPYTTVSQILNGRLNHAAYLGRIRNAIKAAPQPMGVAA